jgi:hypothetical protein
MGFACLALLAATGGRAVAASGQALVIGEASYASLPALPGCALSAHAVAAALRGLGFAVDEQVDGSSGALYAAIGGLTKRLAAAPKAPAFVYFCGYATRYEDRPFVLPVSASVDRPADALTQGLLAKTLVGAASGGKTAAAVLALDTVAMPNGPAVLPLDALMRPALPPTLGYIATVTRAPGNTPTPFATALVPLLHGTKVDSGRLLTDIQQQMAGLKTAAVVSLHVPDTVMSLTAPPVVAQPVVAATPAPSSSAATPAPSSSAATPAASPPVAPAAAVGSPAAPPPASVAAVKALPDEDQMTDDQRRLVQRALAHLGYYDARTDGVFGPETHAAIRRWQHEVHAPMTGHLTAGEASKLASSWD